MKLIYYFLFAIISLPAFGQDTTYLDKYRREVHSPDSLSYFKIVEKDKKDTNEVNIQFYYKSGKLKSETHYSYNKLNGVLLTYWENGTMKRKDEYMNGVFQKGACYDSTGIEIPHFDYTVKPQYPGGTEALLKYIQMGSKKNKWDHSLSVGGELVVKFIVGHDGKPNDVWVMKSISKEIDEQAKQLIFDMPAWKPGKQDGELIEVTYKLPIRIYDTE